MSKGRVSSLCQLDTILNESYVNIRFIQVEIYSQLRVKNETLIRYTNRT